MKKNFSRRQIIFGTINFGLAVSILYGGSVFAKSAPDIPKNFNNLSRTLVGKHELNDAIIARAWFARSKKSNNFSERYAALSAAWDKGNFLSVEDVKIAPLFQNEQYRQTIIDIISAYYLGRVGEVKADTQVNAPVPVTYAQALMWDPTLDVTVLPTYSRGGPGYWRKSPTTIATD